VAASVVAASTAGVLAEGASELEASAGGSAEGLFEVPASEEDLLEAASSDDPASSDGPASSGERRSFLAVGAGAGAVAGASERSALEPSLPRRAGPWYQRLSAGNESGRAVPVGAVAGAEEAGAGADTTEEPEIRPRKRKRRQIARRAAAGLPGSLFSTARHMSRAPGRTHQRTPQAAPGALLVPPEIPVVVWETASQPHPTLSLQGPGFIARALLLGANFADHACLATIAAHAPLLPIAAKRFQLFEPYSFGFDQPEHVSAAAPICFVLSQRSNFIPAVRLLIQDVQKRFWQRTNKAATAWENASASSRRTGVSDSVNARPQFGPKLGPKQDSTGRNGEDRT
jgi:hypothetical protein